MSESESRDTTTDTPVGTTPARLPAASTSTPPRSGALPILAAVVSLLAVGAVWFVLQNRINDLEDQVATLESSQPSPVDSELEASVADLGERVASMESLLGLDGSAPVDQSSAAVGTAIEPFSAVLWSTGQETTVDPADGTTRLFMVAAHWCPYCGATLETLVPVWDDFDFGDVEFMMISTAQDPTRGTPEDEYLADLNPPFPVIIDPSGAPLATMFAVDSFPTWIAVDGTGEVLGRYGGMIDDPAQFAGLIEQLRQIDEAG